MWFVERFLYDAIFTALQAVNIEQIDVSPLIDNKLRRNIVRVITHKLNMTRILENKIH